MKFAVKCGLRINPPVLWCPAPNSSSSYMPSCVWIPCQSPVPSPRMYDGLTPSSHQPTQVGDPSLSGVHRNGHSAPLAAAQLAHFCCGVVLVFLSSPLRALCELLSVIIACILSLNSCSSLERTKRRSSGGCITSRREVERKRWHNALSAIIHYSMLMCERATPPSLFAR